MEILVTTAFGLEAVLKRELEKFGFENPKAFDGKVHIEGNIKDIAFLNVNLRTADRVLLKLAEFKATTFDELFNGISKIPFENYIKNDAQVKMDGNCVKSTLGAIKTSGGIIKKAVMKRLEKFYNSPMNETGEPITIVFNIVKDIATISLDTSGDGLHKRGYRTLNYTAPLKETLAAGLIMLTYYNINKPFADIFCGSGTIPIEAALFAMNIAPNKNRHFAFENFKNYNPFILNDVIAEAIKNEKTDTKPNIYACDINPEAIKMAKFHAEKAGVLDLINFEVNDMKNFSSSEEFGVIVSNPPYGDRIGDKNALPELYTNFGRVFKNLPKWNCYVLTDNKFLEKYFNKKADKKRKLYNANIECVYYSFLSPKPEKC